MTHSETLLARYRRDWHLTALAAPFSTATSSLQKVCLPDGRKAMLKVTTDTAEQRGGRQLLGWQQCCGAVPIYAHASGAFLLALAPATVSALSLARKGGASDDQASLLLSANRATLHQVALSQFRDLQPLSEWFSDLWGPECTEAKWLPVQQLAEKLLASPQSCVSLHGDGHHDNLLYFGSNDWRVIDPKGLKGEHYFDYVPILANPDLGSLALDSKRFERQLALVCRVQDLDPKRLAQWVAVTAALSAAWFLEDGAEAQALQQWAMMQLALSQSQRLL